MGAVLSSLSSLLLPGVLESYRTWLSQVCFWRCRLMESCTTCVAQHLLELVQQPLFSQLVAESAQSVSNRQEFDSIPVVDDVRYHIAQQHGTGELSGDTDCLHSCATCLWCCQAHVHLNCCAYFTTCESLRKLCHDAMQMMMR